MPVSLAFLLTVITCEYESLLLQVIPETKIFFKPIDLCLLTMVMKFGVRYSMIFGDLSLTKFLAPVCNNVCNCLLLSVKTHVFTITTRKIFKHKNTIFFLLIQIPESCTLYDTIYDSKCIPFFEHFWLLSFLCCYSNAGID